MKDGTLGIRKGTTLYGGARRMPHRKSQGQLGKSAAIKSQIMSIGLG